MLLNGDVVFYEFAGWDEFSPDRGRISSCLKTLDVDHSPQNCDKVVSHNEMKLIGGPAYGVDIFVVGKILFKSVYVCTLTSRQTPFVDGIHKWLNYQICFLMRTSCSKTYWNVWSEDPERNGFMMES